MRPTATELAATLGLTPHPEGGFYVPTYRAAQAVQTPRGARPASTAILYLVSADSISHLHRLASDELWVFQGGLPLELLTLSPDGRLAVHLLGPLGQPGPAGGAAEAAVDGAAPSLLPQALVPAGSWQAARLAGGPHLPAERAWGLVTCVVTPGFDYADFELGKRERLLDEFPEHADAVRELT